MDHKHLLKFCILSILIASIVVGCGTTSASTVPEAQATQAVSETETQAPTAEPLAAEPTPTEPPAETAQSSLVDPLTIGDPERGKEIFMDRHLTKCEGCHSLDGTEFRGAPTMLGISARLAERMPVDSIVDYLQQSILEPSAYLVEGFEDKMPTFTVVEQAKGQPKVPATITEQELNDLIAFMLSQ